MSSLIPVTQLLPRMGEKMSVRDAFNTNAELNQVKLLKSEAARASKKSRSILGKTLSRLSRSRSSVASLNSRTAMGSRRKSKRQNKSQKRRTASRR